MHARRSRGVTYLELVATATIVMILASAILPLGRVAVKRQKEIELRRALRGIRDGIDRYKLAVDQGQIGGTEVKLGSEGYPEELDKLVKGVTRVGALDRKLKFLRRIPTDPITGTPEWGMRCYQDDPDSTSWCGENVYDVYSKLAGSEAKDLLPTLEAIEQMAEAAGLHPASRALRRESVEKAPLERVAVTLPLEGSYAELVGFLRGVERQPRFLTVDRVALRADAESGGALQVELSTYLRQTSAARAARRNAR